MQRRFLALSAVILIAIFSRLLPHPWNWTAVGAAALLGGARFEKTWEALLVPLLALVLTDAVLGFHDTLAFVYGAIALTALVAHVFGGRIAGWRVGVAAAAAAFAFYLITNFGVWWMGGMYSPGLSGLWASYIAGLPFLASQLMGDVFYSLIFFAVWDAAENRVPSLARRP